MGWVFAPLSYGLIGFGFGFLFGALREILLIPLFGHEHGHLLEFIPLIIAISVLGFWITAHWKIRNSFKALQTGILGVAFLLLLESTLALFIWVCL